MTTVIEIAGRPFEVVPFGCRPGCRYCTHGEWRRLPWWTTAHFIADGAPTCGGPMDVPAMVPAPEGPHCRACMAVFARRMRDVAEERIRRQQAVERAAERERARAEREATRTRVAAEREAARAARAVERAAAREAAKAARAAERAAAREARQAAQEAARTARSRPEPGEVFAGVDPLVDVLHRYERGQL